MAADQADDLWAAALAEAAPEEAAQDPSTAADQPAHPALQGPVVDPNAQDVVTSQSQVDDLLASLGF
ncbi:protein phosphatase CheZ [Comamonas aquatica]